MRNTEIQISIEFHIDREDRAEDPSQGLLGIKNCNSDKIGDFVSSKRRIST
jgi:hypothetical protein